MKASLSVTFPAATRPVGHHELCSSAGSGFNAPQGAPKGLELQAVNIQICLELEGFWCPKPTAFLCSHNTLMKPWLEQTKQSLSCMG